MDLRLQEQGLRREVIFDYAEGRHDEARAEQYVQEGNVSRVVANVEKRRHEGGEGDKHVSDGIKRLKMRT